MREGRLSKNVSERVRERIIYIERNQERVREKLQKMERKIERERAIEREKED